MGRWFYCNLLEVESERRHLWQFTSNGDLRLAREKEAPPTEQLPAHWVRKDWRSLLRPKLNIAWIPPEEVFLRVIQLPAGPAEEIRAMVEFQLEKLSPLPVGQIYWTAQIIPPQQPRSDNQQTVLVVVVERDRVEEFLGKLEQDGYTPDRLELKFLDQILATRVDGDGVWVYPGFGSDQSTFVLAWWYGGILRHLGMVHVPQDQKAGDVLQEQIAQMAWAGELEGWLTAPPKIHLVAQPEATEPWAPVLNRSGETLVFEEPLHQSQLALSTARRAVAANGSLNLLPEEFARRYDQQRIDRLWMRGLLGLVVAYLFGVLVYVGALQFLKFQNDQVTSQLREMSGTYTNALQMKEQIRIVEAQATLKTAALDSLKEAVERLRTDWYITTFTYSEGKRGGVPAKLVLSGTAPRDQMDGPVQYFTELRQARNSAGQPLFDLQSGDPPSPRVTPSGELEWSMTLYMAVGPGGASPPK